MKRKTWQIIFLVTILSGAANAQAAEINNVRFDNVYTDEGIDMVLQGTGLKSMIFFKAFVAGFYQNGVFDQNNIGRFPKRIEVEYFVSIPAHRMQNYTIDRMKANVSKSEFEAITSEVERMRNYFVDLNPGDRFSLTYIPGVGTKFAHNDQLTGIIKGSDFAHALFSVWLGEKPFDKRLKEQILGPKSNVNKEERVVYRGKDRL